MDDPVPAIATENPVALEGGDRTQPDADRRSRVGDRPRHLDAAPRLPAFERGGEDTGRVEHGRDLRETAADQIGGGRSDHRRERPRQRGTDAVGVAAPKEARGTARRPACVQRRLDGLHAHRGRFRHRRYGGDLGRLDVLTARRSLRIFHHRGGLRPRGSRHDRRPRPEPERRRDQDRRAMRIGNASAQDRDDLAARSDGEAQPLQARRSLQRQRADEGIEPRGTTVTTGEKPGGQRSIRFHVEEPEEGAARQHQPRLGPADGEHRGSTVAQRQCVREAIEVGPRQAWPEPNVIHPAAPSCPRRRSPPVRTGGKS